MKTFCLGRKKTPTFGGRSGLKRDTAKQRRLSAFEILPAKASNNSSWQVSWLTRSPTRLPVQRRTVTLVSETESCTFRAGSGSQLRGSFRIIVRGTIHGIPFSSRHDRWSKRDTTTYLRKNGRLQAWANIEKSGALVKP